MNESSSDAALTFSLVRQLMTELGLAQSGNIIFQNNMGAITWANAGTANQFSRRKHIDIRHDYDVAMVEKGKIVLEQVLTTSMIAEFLTNLLCSNGFTSALLHSVSFEGHLKLITKHSISFDDLPFVLYEHTYA